MIRQDIRIGDYTNKGTSLTSYKFIVDLYKAGVDFKEDIKKNYVMLRKYSIVNDVVYDSDIYIIERDIINRPKLAYAVTNGSFVGFSSDAASFNENLSDKNCHIGGDEVYDIYEKENDDIKLASVPCDKIRIYHPNNKTSLKSIIYVDMQIRGVHFHLLCRPYETYKTNAEGDFESEHIKYSEFIECWIPNIEWLMSGSAYYQEHLTKIGIDPTDSSLIYYHTEGDKIQYCSLKLFSLPFKIETDNEDKQPFKRYKYDSDGDVAHNYITWPIRITIAPYTYIDTTTHLYINDSTLMMNSDVMQEEARMTLQASLGFDDNGNHAVIAKFDYPGKGTDNYYKFAQAYEHFYNVDLNEYEGIVEYDEDDEDDYIEQKQCGCILQVYSDIYMTRKVGQFIYDIDNPSENIGDFAFQTAGMFECWEQLPSILVMQCKFVDRWLGNVIKSNPIVISESSFKYFINKTDTSIVNWTGEQNIYNTPEDIYKKIKEAEDKKMNISYINFIDKITCTVRKKPEVNDIQSNRSNTRVLYKPIFFRTQDLQSITVHNGIKQNIGINLSEYMTKVDTFRLKIGNVNVSESARNDIYVIFSIDASSLGSNSGTYHISNQDDEYISSGKYNVIE